ncbi:hypothetical protein CLV97_10244 [Planifilum fimeticola]|uniref:Uncharacterized protein n=1 Tax=Planifilum fimeticola TaxID=201975 RepID=A0A2T0LIN6_9BACL|nr:hypothetical protein CLV97_10244 [Planifilum fimeticola]
MTTMLIIPRIPFRIKVFFGGIAFDRSSEGQLIFYPPPSGKSRAPCANPPDESGSPLHQPPIGAFHQVHVHVMADPFHDSPGFGPFGPSPVRVSQVIFQLLQIQV